MAGAAPVEAGRGGRRPVDATVNLVPFIDLLSGLITFLLITAVWTQVSALPAASAGSGGGGPSVAPVHITLTAHGAWIGPPEAGKAVMLGDPDVLTRSLLDARMAALSPEALIHTDDDVIYDAVVQVMDACRAAGFENVALTGQP